MIIFDSNATFTRPADTTAYANGDLVANSVTAGSVTPLFFSIPGGRSLKIYRAGIKFNSAVVTNAKFKLHLYKTSPTCTNGDNGAWLTTESKYQDSIAIDCTGQTFSDSSKGFGIYVNTALSIPMLCVTDTATPYLYGLLMATAAYTPTSGEIFTVNLLGESYQ